MTLPLTADISYNYVLDVLVRPLFLYDVLLCSAKRAGVFTIVLDDITFDYNCARVINMLRNVMRVGFLITNN